MLKSCISGLALLALTTAPVAAETVFTVLGSGGGPMARADRFQPANLLTVNGRHILIDAGDGLSERLAAKRLRMGDVDDLVISHLHFDHVGGLLAVLGLRFQTNPSAPVHVYGPPGTKALVDGVLQGMAPAMEAAYGMDEQSRMTPEQLVDVHEIRGGDSFQLGEVTVTAARNSHYSFPEGSEMARKYESLALRFDTPDRSIVYTGDTGWSDEVVGLAKGADLMVSELIDLPAVMEIVQKTAPAALVPQIEAHLSQHHVTPEQVGRMAAAAGVGKLVATHLVAGPRITPEQTKAWAEQIGQHFKGEIAVAEDLADY